MERALFPIALPTATGGGQRQFQSGLLRSGSLLRGTAGAPFVLLAAATPCGVCCAKYPRPCDGGGDSASLRAVVAQMYAGGSLVVLPRTWISVARLLTYVCTCGCRGAPAMEG